MRFDIEQGLFIEQNQGAELPALNDGERTLTWREFASAVAAWVERARHLGAVKNVPLVIYGHKEANFFIAMTGCLVIGAPFVPADTIYPEERLERIKAASGATLCYTSEKNEFTATGHAIGQQTSEADLAYILFTSGSTGEPKGVQIGRDSVASMVTWMSGHFGLGDAPIFMNQAPFSFDLSMYEVMATLSMGGCCVLNDRKLIGKPLVFLERQRDAGISCWVSTPSFAHQQLLNKQFCADFLPTLKTFLFCGEPLAHAIAKRLRERFPNSIIINTYGPTEATVASTWIIVDDALLAKYNPLPVGYSKPDGHIFLDAHSGEICIAGDHVMRGYLNNPELNAEKLFECRGHRAFRTGDLGEIDANGLIFCRGRIDDQIKFNGFRIELSDIDNALQRLDGIASAATVALRRPDGTVGRLLGFLVSENGLTNKDTLDVYKSKLGQMLPNYMVPSELIVTTSLPLSINHKVDRKALADGYRNKNLAQ
ncbi:D-alanine--poly(phosphoribitol) ligase [Janthinobacterium sp. LB2P49]|uniref:D-alanine--poly(phosphoribitol) ligase n=1 Tax=Janthinobacterium sp. LB2P49 TaxID=3424198 RepID=UPI003F224BE0